MTTLPSLGSIFDMITEATQGSSQNTGFEIFGRNVRTSNSG